MKKNAIKLEKSLSFDKETIAKLNDEQLSALEGGVLREALAGTASCNQGPQTTGNTSCEACSCNG